MRADTSSLGQAIEDVAAAARLDPSLCDAWVALAPLLFESGDEPGAIAAAQHALATGPGRAEAALTAAYLDYRDGEVARAESLFTVAIPGLPPALAARFADLEPLLRPEDAERLEEMPPPQQREFVRRFWSEADPDPATRENEAQLEYWARVAHASLVYLDPSQPRWDTRAELYVRYGAPRGVRYEPPGLPLSYQAGRPFWVEDGHGQPRAIGMTMDYPLHSQLYDYSHLGMLVPVFDFALSDHYRLWLASSRSPDPVPDARTLARSDLLATAGGRAVFPVLPPHVKPLRIEGGIARFEGASGGRLLAQVEAPGTPADSIWAQCVVVDSSEHELARAARLLSPSGCDPTELRTGEFGFDVRPGAYRVAFSVRDGHGARGVARATQRVEPAPAGLSMSDVVVVCGPIDVGRAEPEIRLGPNLRARVAGGGPLIAYFEVYRMTPGPDGRARFECTYSIESDEKVRRPWFRRLLPFGDSERQYAARSEDTNVGSLRRQFITVPVSALRPGRYRLIVKVRDLTTGGITTASAQFERVGGRASGG